MVNKKIIKSLSCFHNQTSLITYLVFQMPPFFLFNFLLLFSGSIFLLCKFLGFFCKKRSRLLLLMSIFQPSVDNGLSCMLSALWKRSLLVSLRTDSQTHLPRVLSSLPLLSLVSLSQPLWASFCPSVTLAINQSHINYEARDSNHFPTSKPPWIAQSVIV